jgi:hypothetical protein
MVEDGRIFRFLEFTGSGYPYDLKAARKKR